MRIGIVDSGVDVRHSKLSGADIKGVYVSQHGGRISITPDFEDRLGHGTAITAIINSHIKNAEFFIAKIFDTELIGSEKVMAAALRWCIESRVDVVNMSLGVVAETPSQELFELCEYAAANNICVVAAAANSTHTTCYPAYFPTVFGVMSGTCNRKNDYGYAPNSPIDFLAKGCVQRVAHLNNSFKIVEGTSYACAHFTGIVANVLTENTSLSLADLKQALVRHANPDVTHAIVREGNDSSLSVIQNDLRVILSSYLDKRTSLNWLGRLALFPVSEKEMQLFESLPTLCNYPITLRLDYIRSSSRTDSDSSIRYRMPSEEDFDSFDTLVVGYFYESLFQANVKYGYKLIQKAVEKGKNFYVFDHILQARINEIIAAYHSPSVCYTPIVDRKTNQIFSYLRYRPAIQTPVLCVTGTTNKQGKFTTQLRIKNLMERSGYQVGFISTEPHGELFGATFSFPFGHNDTVFIDYRSWPDFLRSLGKAVEYYHHPDIILTGTQSWGIPPSFSMHPCGGELDAVQYLFGIQPDAVVCAINPNDSIELIRRTMNAIQLTSAAKILFFVITPWLREFTANVGGAGVSKTCLTKNELKEKIAFYEQQLQIPVIDIMDQVNDNFILETICKFYS